MSSFAFTNGAYNRAPGTIDAFGGLSDDLVAEGHPPMVSRSGDREYEDQLRIWNARMVLHADINGRKVYGTKKWQGKTWYRIHPDTVAVPTNPPTSNHGKRRSNDLLYPYNNRNTAAHRRARVLAQRHDITWEGINFNEDWHWTYWGPLGAVLAGNGASPAEGTLIVNDNDKQWLNGMGASIKKDVIDALRADIATVHDSVIQSRSDVLAHVAQIRADVNYVHTLSPYSLKAILEAAKGGAITLTPEQVDAISGQLTAGAVAGLDAALKDDFEGLKALMAEQPPEFVAALKAAL